MSWMFGTFSSLFDAFLSHIIDSFGGMAVSWTIGANPDAQLVNTMLDAAIEKVTETGPTSGHSDRGGPYRWPMKNERGQAHPLHVPQDLLS